MCFNAPYIMPQMPNTTPTCSNGGTGKIDNNCAHFVVQEHTRKDQPIHWDLMLQAGEALQTYRLDAPPERISAAASPPCTATRIHDHPLRFLTYQGSVNKGRGTVRIVDSGTYQLIDHSADYLLLDFHGEILSGKFRLAHVENDQWELHRRLNSANLQGH